MSLSRADFVTRIMNLVGSEFPHLEGPDLSLGEVKAFRLKLGDVLATAIQDACDHSEPEKWLSGPPLVHYCALCGAVLPPKETK